jgi:hypothetical protein
VKSSTASPRHEQDEMGDGGGGGVGEDASHPLKRTRPMKALICLWLQIADGRWRECALQ